MNDNSQTFTTDFYRVDAFATQIAKTHRGILPSKIDLSKIDSLHCKILFAVELETAVDILVFHFSQLWISNSILIAATTTSVPANL